jgi:predicted acyltransferase
MVSGDATVMTRGRLMSLDALRGFDMFWIIGGSGIVRALARGSTTPWVVELDRQMQHVEWEGFRFYDLIFPLFLFMIGVAIPLSIDKRLSVGESRGRIYRRIAVRVAVMIVLGMMINGNLLSYDPSKFQLTYSVLQMLALGYLVASVIYLNCTPRGQMVITAAMLVIYYALEMFVPVPGFRWGVLAEHVNFGDWFNDQVLGAWQGRWRLGWIVGVLGHASTAMLGVHAAGVLRSSRGERAKVLTLLAIGGGCLVIAVVWSGWLAGWVGGGWADWPIWFPIVKNRWTSTFALFAGGWSFGLLAVFYLVIDVWQWRRWAYGFVVIGSNALLAYLSMMLGRGVFRAAAEVFIGGLKRLMTPGGYEALATAATFAVLWAVLWQLHRRRVYLRL